MNTDKENRTQMTQIYKIKYDFFGILIHKDIKKIIPYQRCAASASSTFQSSEGNHHALSGTIAMLCTNSPLGGTMMVAV